MRVLAVFAAILSCYVAPAFAQVDYDALKHVDLRDLGANDTYLHSTSNAILGLMQANPAAFIGPVMSDGKPNAAASTSVVYWPNGAEGPRGNEVQSAQDGKTYWVLDPDSDPTQQQRTASRKNTIFSAEFEEIEEEIINQKFKLKLILFVHDPSNPVGVVSNGYFFRRVWILVDYTDPNKKAADISVLSAEPDIPLTATQFQISGDILERKLILEDLVYGITKVFPLGVGSFHIRTGRGMDGAVKSMTREFKPGAYLESTRVSESGSAGNNTRMRLYPSYYAGRPFFGIKTADGTYHSIGFHWRIDMDRLHRGFVSHGCVRTQDKDLYQLDAILNEGGQQRIPVVMANHLGGRFERMSHPYPNETTSYWAAVYSAVPSENSIRCRFNTYDVIRDKVNPQIHTVADNSCLTYTYKIEGNPDEVVFYIKTGQIPPRGLYAGGMQHVPIRVQGGDTSAFECYNPEGGEAERENDRRDFGTFLDGIGKGFENIFSGNAFKSKKQRQAERMACDQTIRLIEVDRNTPMQAPVQPMYLPDFTPSVISGVAPATPVTAISVTPAPVAQDNSNGEVVFGPGVDNSQPVVKSTLQERPVVVQVDCESLTPTIGKPRNLQEQITLAEQTLNQMDCYQAQWCKPVKPEAVSQCSDWKTKTGEWTAFLARAQQLQIKQQQK